MNILFIFLAGLWSMDHNTAFNFMISRPIVVSAVIGAICGNFMLCILGGIFFELVGLTDVPVGTSINDDDTFGAFSYSYVISHMHGTTVEYACLMIFVSYLLMRPATLTIVVTRWINKKLYLRYPINHEGGLILMGQLIAFFRGAVVYFGASVMLLSVVLRVNINIPTLNPWWITLFFFFISGYYSGFLHDSVKTKLILIMSGGIFSWLIL